VSGKGIEGAFAGILADINFVDVASFRPGRPIRALTKGNVGEKQAKGKQKISHALKLTNLIEFPHVTVE